MYQVGDLILYGSTGVCRIKDIQEGAGRQGGEKRLYYILEPLYQSCVISTPVDNDKVFMRPVLSRQEADELIDRIPSIQAEAYHGHALRELTEHYVAALKTYDCGELVEMTMSIYEKKRDMARQHRKFGALDERFMKRAEDLLFGELAVALEISKDEVPDYISRRVKTLEKEKQGAPS